MSSTAFTKRACTSRMRSRPAATHDPHIRERGMLEEIDHPELGLITVPTTPLHRLGLAKVPAGPSPTIGQHNAEIYGDWLGLSADELAVLKAEGVI